MIARRALDVNRGDYFELVTSKRMQLTQHDCYKTVTQRIQEKCFDLPVSAAAERLCHDGNALLF